LNAIITGTKYITGDIVTFLHSDDLYIDKQVFRSFVKSFEDDQSIQGLYGDLNKIDGKGNPSGQIRLEQFNSKKVRDSIFSNFGSNPLSDIFVVRTEIFKSYVFKNYLINNTIYYIDYSTSESLILKKIRPFYCYRVFEENYINSEIGQFVVLNGKLRTITMMLKSGLMVPQKRIISPVIYKAYKKILGNYSFIGHFNFNFAIRFLKLWYKVLKKQNYSEFALDSLQAAIRSYSSSSGKIYNIEKMNFKNYDGKDARLFFRDKEQGKLDQLYLDLIYENISKIIASNYEIKENVDKALFFLSLNYQVEVK